MSTDIDQVLADIADVKTIAVETDKDVRRVVDLLGSAAAAGDLGTVRAAVADLRDLIAGTDAAAEAAAPEPAAAPVDEPTADTTTTDPAADATNVAEPTDPAA